METTIERLEDNKVKLTVTVPAADVDKVIAETYADLSGKYKIPGFRQGKAPRPVVDNFVGRGAIMAQALERVVDNTYPKALSDAKVRPIDQPDMGELSGLEAGEDYRYTAEVEVRPELTLSSTEGLKAEVSPSKATEREIDLHVNYTRERFATLETVEDRGVQSDDYVLLSFVGTVAGEPYEGNTVDKYLYEMGRGLMTKEFDEGLIGHRAGEHVIVEFTIPETSSVPEYVGKPARFEVDIHEVKAKVLPPLDDEYATNVGGFDSMAEYRDDIRKKLDESKLHGHIQEVERAVRAALAERLEGDMPESLVRERSQEMARDFFNNLKHQNITLEAYVQATGVTPDQIQADIAASAESSLREELAMEALFRQLGFEVTDADIQDELRVMSGEGEDADKFGEKLRATGTMPVLIEQIMHKQAVRWLMDNVEVIERDVAPGTEAAEPAAEEAAEAKPKRSRKSAKPQQEEKE